MGKIWKDKQMQSGVVWTPKLLDHDLKTSERCVGKRAGVCALNVQESWLKFTQDMKTVNIYTASCQWTPYHFLSSWKHQYISHYSLRASRLLSFGYTLYNIHVMDYAINYNG